MMVELVTGKDGESELRQDTAVPRLGETVYVKGAQYRVSSVEWSFLHPDSCDKAIVYLLRT